MANNKIQIKRTSVAGRTANVTNSGNSQYIAAGELALNMPDGILYSSNGSALITVGANLVNQNVTGNLTVKAIIANSSLGTAGQVLTTNSTGVYWSTVGGSGTVTSVATGNGMTGGPITTTGTVSILANTGIVANATGTYVNATYIGTLTANNTNFVGSVSAANVVSNAQLSSNLSNYVTTTNLTNNLANYQTTAGLSANVATLTANNANFVKANNGIVSNSSGVFVNGNTGVVVNSTGVFVNATYISTLTANNTNFVGTISAANVVSNAQLSSNLSNYQTTAGLASNVATLTSNNSTFSYGKTEGALNVNSALTANNSTNLGGVAAASYVQNTDSRTLSGNLVFSGANVNFAGNTTVNSAFVSNGLYISTTTVVNSSILQSNNVSAIGGVIRAGSDATNTIISNSALSVGINAQRAFNLIGTDGVLKVVRTANGNPGIELQQRDGESLKSFYDIAVINDTLAVRDRTTGTANTRLFISNSGNVGLGGNTTPSHRLSVNGSISLNGGIDANGSLGSVNDVLTSNGSSVYWATAAGGSSNAVYMKGGAATIGTLAAGGSNIFRVNANTLNYNTTIATGENASATGPLAVADGITLTVQSGARVSII